MCFGTYLTNTFFRISKYSSYSRHSESFAKGYVVLNEGATEALVTKASSVLLVGITEVGGEFAKGDIVKILNSEKEELGVGIAQYDSDKARESIGKKGQRAFIHYDYLYLD